MKSALICCDSFKGTLSSIEVNTIISHLLEKANIKTYAFEFSDGGEGLLNALKPILKNHQILKLKTVNHAYQEIESEVLVNNDTAYLESANVVGLDMIPLENRHILNLDTYGLGLLIKYLYQQGIKKFAVGLGGSGTNDYGIGFLQGLGYLFLNKNEEIVKKPLIHMNEVVSIKSTINYQNLEFLFISDVINPAVGDFGAAKVFGHQKNASEDDINFLNYIGQTYIKLLRKYNQKINEKTPYLGAAGGIALSLATFFKCKFVKGAKFILDQNKFSILKDQYDYIITGEGQFDFQSLFGKIVGEMIEQLKDKKPLIVFTGKLKFTNQEKEKLKEHPNLSIYECVSVKNDPSDFIIKQNAINNLESAVIRFITDRKEEIKC